MFAMVSVSEQMKKATLLTLFQLNLQVLESLQWFFNMCEKVHMKLAQHFHPEQKGSTTHTLYYLCELRRVCTC